jgi:hypothetical protein
MSPKPLLMLILLLLLLSCKKEDNFTGNEHLTKIDLVDSSGQLLSTSEYKYDSAERLVMVPSTGSAGTVLIQIEYEPSGKPKSCKVSNSRVGDQLKFDFQTDAIGKIVRANGTAFQPNSSIDSHTYTYDGKGRLIIDSFFTQSGALNGYVNFEYDNNDNVIAYQLFNNQGASLYTQGRWTFQYDSKHNPFYQIGQLLYTSLGGSGINYSWLSKNNPLSASLNNIVITPGGGFRYQYYSNSLPKTSAVRTSNSLIEKYYYSN